jgi:hypothetical protein
LFELGARLIDGGLKRRRRTARKRRAENLTVRFCGFDESPERGLAFRDAQLVRRRRVKLFGVLEFEERFVEACLALQLVALPEEIARSRAFGVVDLSERRSRECPGEQARGAEKAEKEEGDVSHEELALQ